MLAQRDGKYLKNWYLQSKHKPATIELNLDSAVKWLHNGAQPTCKNYSLTKGFIETPP
jgi:small subunit ribosomal protein S16